MVACILMHDGFHATHDVAHAFIEYLSFADWPNVTPNIILHINDSWFRATSCTLRGHEIKCGGFFWRFKGCCMVACILMHDRFHAAHDVAHGFIEYPAVRGLTKRNSKRHSSHQRFLISSKHNTDQWTPIGIFGSVHLDARQISHRMPFPLCEDF